MPASDIIRGDGQQAITNIFGDVSQMNVLDYQVLGETVAMIQSFPALRGAWLTASRDENGALYDISGQGRTLTNNNAATFGVEGLQSYATLDGVNQYFSRADEAGLDITGEITFGAWVRFRSLTSGMIAVGKESAGVGNYGYEIGYSVGSGLIIAKISDDGTNFTLSSSASSPSANQWYFIAGRFYPGVSIDLCVNNAIFSTPSAFAGIFNNAAAFTVGGIAGGAVFVDGDITLPFVCAAAVSDGALRAYYNVSRNLFGV